MGEKSEQKREYILTMAREVFEKKGFRDATMKDIVEACGISRGGLYLYFSSTKEVYEAILESSLEEEGEDPATSISAETTMADILMLFFKEQKRLILKKKEDISIATYEYLFAHRPQRAADNKILNQFRKGIMVLTRILEEGVANGEFYCEDPEATASHIMYVLEGMKICQRTMGLTESRVDKELMYILSGLLIDEG